MIARLSIFGLVLLAAILLPLLRKIRKDRPKRVSYEDHQDEVYREEQR